MKFKSLAIETFYEKNKGKYEIDHVIDFLDNVYPHKKRFNFSYEQALEKANGWTKELNKKNQKNLVIGQIELILDLSNGFKLVKLIDQDSKNWEGFYMGHCVASYENHQGIYSIRDKDNFPVCTIEIRSASIKQIKVKANRSVSPKYIKYCLKAIKYFNYKLSTNDIKNLGYSKEIDLNFIKNHFKNYKITKINNQEFLYTKNKLKLVNKFNESSSYLLNYFCRYNQSFDAIKLLVENGADIHAQDDEALISARYYEHLEIVKCLIENGANIHVRK